jgi:hypothetical protein
LGSGASSLLYGIIGTATIYATYHGDSLYTGSTASLNQVINATTTTSITSSPNPSTFGQAVTFTASVTGPPWFNTTGTVTFLDGTAAIGSAAMTLIAGQVTATFTTSNLSRGSHSITAIYSGMTNYNGSTSGVLTQVVQ